jgi:sugar phosphate isomerase/epimerase
MNLYWTTSGLFPGEGEISPRDFRDRVVSAAKHGFVGVGLWHTDLEHARLHHSYAGMRRMMEDHGIKYLELEFLTDWFQEGARKAESDDRKKRLLEASAELNAKHIKIGDFYNSPKRSMAQITDAFGKLCEEADEFGAVIGLEFMMNAAVGTLEDALDVVQTVNKKNGGIILDTVQAAVLGITPEALRRIPREYLVNVELDDGALPGSPLYDASRLRRFCEEGDFPLRQYIEAILATGYEGPWAVEVFSKELSRLPLDELNQRAFETTMNLFEGILGGIA